MKTPLNLKKMVAKLHAMSYAERAEIAKKAGLSVHTVHKYCYDYNVPKRPGYDTVMRIWAAL